MVFIYANLKTICERGWGTFGVWCLVFGVVVDRSKGSMGSMGSKGWEYFPFLCS
jgi:hypothetical protein